MEITVSDILKSPGAVKLYQQIQEALADETRRREEFREWLSADVKAEFINGEIVLHSPVKRGHLKVSGRLFKLLDTFAVSNQVGEVSAEKALVALTRNDYEPDICFWNKEKTIDFTNDTMLHPAPDFIVEILSPSTKKYDRTIKFEDYALHGIREYWIIDPDKQCVEQYALLVPTDTTYLPYGKFFPGEDIKSIVLPEFEIPVAAIFDEKANFEALKKLME